MFCIRPQVVCIETSRVLLSSGKELFRGLRLFNFNTSDKDLITTVGTHYLRRVGIKMYSRLRTWY